MDCTLLGKNKKYQVEILYLNNLLEKTEEKNAILKEKNQLLINRIQTLENTTKSQGEHKNTGFGRMQSQSLNQNWMAYLDVARINSRSEFPSITPPI